jgi:hypothetical protein
MIDLYETNVQAQALYRHAEGLTYGSPKFVMTRLDRATSSNTMLREVARSSRAMTCWGRVNVNADRYYTGTRKV